MRETAVERRENRQSNPQSFLLHLQTYLEHFRDVFHGSVDWSSGLSWPRTGKFYFNVIFNEVFYNW